MFAWLMKQAGGKTLLLALGMVILPLAGMAYWINALPLARVLYHRLPDLRLEDQAANLYETIVLYEQHRPHIALMYGLDLWLAAGIFLFFALLLGWCLKPQRPGQAAPAWMLAIPFSYLVCECWEDFMVLMFTWIYPSPLILQLFPLFRGVMLGKFALLGLVLAAVLAAAAVWLWRRLFGAKTPAAT